MTIDDSTSLDGIDKQSIGTDLGPITPTTLAAGFTSHTEGIKQGGKQYWRCECCGVECVRFVEQVLTNPIEHRDDCENPHVRADQ